MKSISEIINEEIVSEGNVRMDAYGQYAFSLLYGYIETHPDVANKIVKKQKELYKKWDPDKESQIEFKTGQNLISAIENVAGNFA